MKTLPIPKDANLSLLCEELFKAFPEWVQPGPRGNVTDVTITKEEIIFPDATNEKEVEKIIRRHDPKKDSTNQAKAKARAEKLQSAKDKLKSLGLTDEEIEALGK